MLDFCTHWVYTIYSKGKQSHTVNGGNHYE
nr:MAG TPA: hypothetical protein [Caudoviricetes sp.]